jgi:hypothetical protein
MQESAPFSPINCFSDSSIYKEYAGDCDLQWLQGKKTFFDVFAVITLFVGQPEYELLQEGVALIPEGRRQAQTLFLIADATYAVFTPAIRAGVALS